MALLKLYYGSATNAALLPTGEAGVRGRSKRPKGVAGVRGRSKRVSQCSDML